MTTFSERMGLAPKPALPHMDYMSHELRNSLWLCFEHTLGTFSPFFPDKWRSFTRIAAFHVLKPSSTGNLDPFSWLHRQFADCDWNVAYDITEIFVLQAGAILQSTNVDKDKLQTFFNRILERESSGYRFLQGTLVPVTNQTELDEITHAITLGTATPFSGASLHIETSVDLLSKKPEPDCRNSVKESISAVESAVRTICGDKNASLQKALGKIHETHPLHGAFKEACVKLYGYTSDEQGIRHSLLESNNCTFEDARFMLVTCSAFVNYIASVAGKSTN